MATSDIKKGPLYVDSTNNRVGIGTSSPAAKLHISGNASNASALSDTVTDFALKFDSAITGSYFSNAICFAEGTNVNASIASFDGGSGGAQGLVFGTGASNTERMRIDSSGNTIIKAGKELRLNRPDDNTYGAISHGASGTGIVYNDVNGDGHHWQLAGSEKMRILSSGGITFNGDTAAANALDDYEEGLWTPTFVSSNGGESVTYDVQKGGYVKVGRLVHIQIQLGTTSVSGGSGYIQIGNLPFANDGTTNGALAIPIELAYGFASTITGGSSAQVGDSSLHFYKNDNSANVWNWTTMATGSSSNRCWISGTYITS